jgi:hypothetical protein
MRPNFLRILVCLSFFALLLTHPESSRAQSGGDFSRNAHAKPLPTDVILVKGAWASASDSVTPVPEGGTVANNVYRNPYFGLTYSFSPAWIKKYDGPPPSDSGYYVLAQLRPAGDFKGPNPGTILIAAQDLFFSPTQAGDALQLINYTRLNLQADYRVELAPAAVEIAGHYFVRLDYFSPLAELHWHVFATQIQCHVVQIIVTNHETALSEILTRDLNNLKLPGEAGLTQGNGGGDVPVCISNYASDENILEREDPVFSERRFNPVPVRIIIDKEGKVKHIHFLSAFPDQSKAISDALAQWRFKPYLRDGKPVEVETGIMFGRAPRPVNAQTSGSAATE